MDLGDQGNLHYPAVIARQSDIPYLSYIKISKTHTGCPRDPVDPRGPSSPERPLLPGGPAGPGGPIGPGSPGGPVSP